MADGEDKNGEGEEFQWTPYAELRLLHAMFGLKPIGPAYHFLIPIIYDKFTEAMGTKVPLKVVKDKIDTMYNIRAADEIFPDDEFSEEEFSLPKIDFQPAGTSKTQEPCPKKKKH